MINTSNFLDFLTPERLFLAFLIIENVFNSVFSVINFRRTGKVIPRSSITVEDKKDTDTPLLTLCMDFFKRLGDMLDESDGTDKKGGA